MFLVFMPVPYVDASAASAFRQKHRRMIVGAIGIMVEMLLAAIAMFVWTNAEYGVVRTIAFNVMLIGGVSTLFFNGNPLLRFDGYYVLADAVEIPNLGKRSQQYLGYLVQQYLFAVENLQSPATCDSERKWFVFYGVTSFIYRMFIASVIILFVAGEFFFIGVILAIWAAYSMLVLPLARNMKFLFTSPKIASKRPRALMVTSVMLGLVVALLFIVPAPYRTMAEGVVWLPEKSSIRAGTSCFIREYVIAPDSESEKDDILIICQDPLLRSREDSLTARLQELKALLAAQWRDDRVAARITREEIIAVEADLKNVRERIDALLIHSPIDGRFISPNAIDLLGSYVKKGDILGYVIEPTPMKVRVVVSEDDVDLVRSRTNGVQVQLSDRLGVSVPAIITRQVPGGTNVLPSAVLGKEGGGEIDIDPRDPNRTQTYTKVFEYDLGLPGDIPRSPAGTRVYVRFDHGSEPLGYQWYRQARQVFLGKFGV